MLMLSKAKEISRENLAAIPTPDPTPTWRPVPHSDVAGALVARAGLRGLKLRSERYAVQTGYLATDAGIQQEISGGRLFGSLDFEPISGLAFPDGCTPSLGVRNSHDKSFSLSVLCGARVVVCANGLLSAEHIIARKHTSGIDLIAAIDAAMDAFMQSIQGFQQNYQRLRAWSVTRAEAHSLIVEMAKAGAFASTDVLSVVAEFENPKHPEFRESNAWSIYQSSTEVMKKQSPARQIEGFRALNRVLLPHLNTSVAA